MVRDLFRKTGRPLEKELDLVQLDCVREHWFDGRLRAGAPGGAGGPAAGLRDARAGTRAVLARPRGSRTPTTGRCCAGATSRCPGTPTHLPREVAARLESRETLHKRLRRSLRDPRARLVAAYPFEADGHAPPRRACLGRAHVVPRAALRRVGRGRRDRRTPGGAGTPARHPRCRRRAGIARSTSSYATVERQRSRRAAASSTPTSSSVPSTRVGSRRWRRTSRARRPAIPPVLCHVGLEGEVRDLPHELVVHGEPLLDGPHGRPRLPRADMPGRWPAAGGSPRTSLAALARHGLDVRAQVVTRLDRSPRELVEQWGGTPLGVQWQGRGTVRRRLGPRYAGRRCLRRREPRDARRRACPSSACPRRWSPRWSGPA